MFALVDKGGDDEPLTLGQTQGLHAFNCIATGKQKELLAKAVKATLAAAAKGGAGGQRRELEQEGPHDEEGRDREEEKGFQGLRGDELGDEVLRVNAGQRAVS
jgi:hypothetical protein